MLVVNSKAVAAPSDKRQVINSENLILKIIIAITFISTFL
jgi:hypothetical protein